MLVYMVTLLVLLIVLKAVADRERNRFNLGRLEAMDRSFRRRYPTLWDAQMCDEYRRLNPECAGMTDDEVKAAAKKDPLYRRGGSSLD